MSHELELNQRLEFLCIQACQELGFAVFDSPLGMKPY